MKYAPHALFLLLALVILGPALAPGNIFLLDMPWPERFQLSDYIQNGLQPHFLLHVLLNSLNLMIPAWVLQKAVLIAVLAGAGSSVYALAKTYLRNSYATYAGLLAMLNPFVFERLAAGQWLVLAGYAYTPFVIYMFVKHKSSWRFWLAYSLLPIISIHFFVMVTLLGLIALAAFNRDQLWQLLNKPKLYLTFLVVNAYWLLPFSTGDNKSVDSLTQSDFEAFATVGDATVGVIGNVVNLYGFWRADTTLKGENGLWFVYGEIIFLLAIYGMYAGARSKKLRRRARASSLTLLLALIFAVGYGHPATRSLIEPLTHLPAAAVLRETAKFVGVLALVYALWAPHGLAALGRRLKTEGTKIPLFAAAITIVMMSGMFFGLNGTLATHEYPRGWHEAEKRLPADANALILPWQGYLELAFADNVYASNPAKVFFSSDVLQSSSAGNPLLVRPGDSIKTLLDQYIRGDITYERFSHELSDTHKATHIVLLKTGNWNKYEILPREKAVYEDGSILSIEL